jgi:hypothetical protein
MKKLSYVFVVLIILFSTGCLKQKFYADPDDPGLSSFTDRQYMTGTCYINGTPYINYWREIGVGGSSSWPTLAAIQNPAKDSIDFSWPIGRWENNKFFNDKYSQISFRFPVPTGFTGRNFEVLDGLKITSVVMYLNYGQVAGAGNIYFVKMQQSNSGSEFFNISGLFDGFVADSILVTKGRFDYKVKTMGY